jgi:hypothetical protein
MNTNIQYKNLDKEFVPCELDERYHVYKDGRIYANTRSKKFMNPQLSNGYQSIKINNKTHLRINRLVAIGFVVNDDPENKTIVNHIDSDKLNNHYTNLEWVTCSENLLHYCRNHVNPSNYNRVTIIEMNLTDETEIEYDSLVNAANGIQIHRSTIQRRLSGETNIPHKNINGKEYNWKYKYPPSSTIDIPEGSVQIKDYPNYYITKQGEIYSKNKQNYKLQSITDDYKRAPLSKNGKETSFFVHRLVAEAFIANPESKPFVNHKNSIKTDNRVENLEWVSAQENSVHHHAQDSSAIRREVYQKNSETHEIINTFRSMKDATSITGHCNEYITKICNGKQVSKLPYYFQYVKDRPNTSRK